MNIVKSLVLVVSFWCIALNAIGGETQFTAHDLDAKWDFYGAGSKKVEHGLLNMKGSKNSAGVMIVSPDMYEDEVVLRYEVMPLNLTTVCVAIMSASDVNSEKELIVPYRYNGGRNFWVNKVRNYYFEFSNSVYNSLPKLVKYPDKQKLALAPTNVMIAGIFNKIEIGRKRDRFWLSINGRELFEIDDDDEFETGKLAIRIEGSFGEKAACLIRNVSVIVD